jgi:MICOS complex subunit MIC19
VQKEIEALKKKLAQRKVREEVVGDSKVEKAKEELVNCLRVNDRRPLDCWKEVEAFKTEVGRLEKGFLGRVLE